MSALGSLLKWIVLLPILLAVVLLAVANAHTVTVHLNPFNVDDPVLRFDLPLYQLAFALFVLGALIGSLVTWAGQHKYRSQSRHREDEAQFWQRRAERAERSERPQPEQQGASRALAFLPRPERS